MSLSMSVPSFEDITAAAQSGLVTRTDSQGDLAVWHYNTDRDDLPDSVLAIRGLVTEGETCRGFFPMTREIVVFEDERKDQAVSTVDELLGESPDLQGITVYESLEAACLLRVFYAADQWFVSTNQKLDASKSSWTCPKNFRQQFQESLLWLYQHCRAHDLRSSDECPSSLARSEHAEFWKSAPEFSTAHEVEAWFLSTLDTSKGYAFLVRPTTENKNFFVSPPSETPSVYNVGVFSGDLLLYNEPVMGIPKPQVVQHPTESSDEDFDLLTWLFNKTSKGGISRQGLMVFTPTTHFKLVSHQYHYKSGLRENNTVEFQYIVYNMNLSLVSDDEYENYKRRCDEFQELYGPVWQGEFDKINDALTDVTWAIAKAYFRRNRPRDRNADESQPQQDNRDMRKLYQPEFKLLMHIHQEWRATEDPETRRKRYRVFRFHNPDQQQRGRRRVNPFQFDPETGMEYNMDAIWNGLYQQDPRNVYQMVRRRLRFGDKWTIYQPENSQNNRRPSNRKQRQSFGRRRMVSRSTTHNKPKSSPAAAE